MEAQSAESSYWAWGRCGEIDPEAAVCVIRKAERQWLGTEGDWGT